MPEDKADDPFGEVEPWLLELCYQTDLDIMTDLWWNVRSPDPQVPLLTGDQVDLMRRKLKADMEERFFRQTGRRTTLR